MTDEVGSQPRYDAFADEFLDHARDGFLPREPKGFLAIRAVPDPRR